MSGLGAIVMVTVAITAVARSAVTSHPPPAPPLTEGAARAFFLDAAQHEIVQRRLALIRFRSSEWSRQDDFHAHEAAFLRDYAEKHDYTVRDVLVALDRGMREKWPAASEPDQRIVPCHPRLSY